MAACIDKAIVLFALSPGVLTEPDQNVGNGRRQVPKGQRACRGVEKVVEIQL